MKTLLTVMLLASPLLAGDVRSAPRSADSCGLDNVKFKVTSSGRQPLVQPEPGKALVYVVEQYLRPANELGKPTIRVGLDGAWMGANRDTSYLYFSVEPGEHHLCTDWQSVPRRLGIIPASLAILRAEPGQSYYFRARVVEHHGYFTLDLDQVNPDEGRMLVETFPLSSYRVGK